MVSEVSQPLVGLLSQFPKFALHAPSVQVPVAQDSAAFARLQGTPQAPQSVSVLRGSSQPFALFPSQFPNPAAQVPSVQTPVEHDSVAFARSQTKPQVGQ